MVSSARNDEPCDVVCASDDRAQWLAHRLSGIGASEIAAVIYRQHTDETTPPF